METRSPPKFPPPPVFRGRVGVGAEIRAVVQLRATREEPPPYPSPGVPEEGIRVLVRVLLIVLLASSALGATSDLQDAWPFIHERDNFDQPCALDLRDLNEKVAGETGFVHLSADGNSFVRGDGTPIRFWPIVTSIYDKSSPDDLARHARFLAKMGVNMVRLHTEIYSVAKDSQIDDVNQQEIDAIWQSVAAFKAQGIYLTISPYWANAIYSSHWGIDGYYGTTDLWGLLFFNDRLQSAYKTWVKKLYTTPNPYTGIPLAQDPAVAIIQVQNEDSMFFWTMQNIKPEQKILLEEKFADWLAAKYGSLAKASDAWSGFSVDGDDFDHNRAGIMQIYQWTIPQSGPKEIRLEDQLQFFTDTERKFYSGMADYYRHDLGCRQLINGSNWITADPQRLGDVGRYADSSVDVLAINRYFTGIHSGYHTGYRVDSTDNFTNNPAVLDPADLPTNLKQVEGHPIIITESTWENPMDFQSEGPFMVAAYESLTGVAGYYWFAATAPEYDPNPFLTFIGGPGQHPFRKWTCSTPQIIGNFPAAALLYRKGYLQQGAPVVMEDRPLADLWQRKLPLIAETPTYDPNHTTSDRPAESGGKLAVDPLAYLVGPVRETFGSDPNQTHVADLSQFIDHDKKLIRAETGEIQLDYGTGMCTIDSPKAQGASGFFKNFGAIHLSTIDLSCNNDHASILVVSMDDKPLNESGKILVQIGTRVRPTGWIEDPADFTWMDKGTFHGFKIVRTGALPFMAAKADGTLTIRNATIKKAGWLFTTGYRGGDLPSTTANGQFQLKLPPDAMYVILE